MPNFYAQTSSSLLPTPPAMPPNQGKPEEGLFGKIAELFGDPSLNYLPAGGIAGMVPKTIHPFVRTGLQDMYNLIEKRMPMFKKIEEINAEVRPESGANAYVKARNAESQLNRGLHGTELDMTPPKDVMDRAINAAGGMNDPRVQRMFGFGQ